MGHGSQPWQGNAITSNINYLIRFVLLTHQPGESMKPLKVLGLAEWFLTLISLEDQVSHERHG